MNYELWECFPEMPSAPWVLRTSFVGDNILDAEKFFSSYYPNQMGKLIILID
jgi:hypothetical protein